MASGDVVLQVSGVFAQPFRQGTTPDGGLLFGTELTLVTDVADEDDISVFHVPIMQHGYLPGNSVGSSSVFDTSKTYDVIIKEH